MKNEHIPFELIEQIYQWVERNLSSANGEHDLQKKLAIIQQTINNLNKLSLEIPKDLSDQEKALKESLAAPNEDKQIMLEMTEKLQELIRYIKQKVSNKGNTGKKGPKAPPKTLCVTLPTGKTIINNTATMTFLETLKYMRLEKITDFSDIRLHGHPVVSRTKNSNSFELKEVEGFFIEVNCNTTVKADILRRYSHKLGLNIQVAVRD
jgi:hypothetical protein